MHSINGTSFLQNIDYRYNTRGWLTNINNAALINDAGVTNSDASNNDQFGMELSYNNNAVSPQYNGNIAKVKSLSGALSGISYPSLVYNYYYDKVNRLTNAISTSISDNDNFYNENISYDVSGNVLKLNRYDKISNIRTPVDSLTFTNVGNKYTRIDDVASSTIGFTDVVQQSNEYSYDGNGNQSKDLNKGFSNITYNLFNLPQTLVRTNGSTVVYVYDANGNKLRKLYTNGSVVSTTEYINGVQYQYDGNTPSIAFVLTEEGRALKNGSVYKYEYDLRDHLGNTRVTATWNASDANQLTPILSQRSDYYAFGASIKSLEGSVPSPKNEYLYNGKEFQEETALYDYGARFYDPAIARMTSIDPHAENFMNYSPYAYAINNPVNVYDPDGRDAIFNVERDKDGNITGVKVSAVIYIQGDGASEERANDLTNAAKSFFKPKTANGLNVSFDIKYKYDENMSTESLRPGENLFKFDRAPAGSNRSGVFSYSIETTNPDGSTSWQKYTGNTGIIYGSGAEDHSILHETGHLLGLSDRYVEESSTPHPGFEQDLMGDSYAVPLQFSPIHYTGFAEATWRYGGKSYLNNSYIDKNSQSYIDRNSQGDFIHTPAKDSSRSETVRKMLKQ